jgi:hypothetical protein
VTEYKKAFYDDKGLLTALSECESRDLDENQNLPHFLRKLIRHSIPMRGAGRGGSVPLVHFLPAKTDSP